MKWVLKLAKILMIVVEGLGTEALITEPSMAIQGQRILKYVAWKCLRVWVLKSLLLSLEGNLGNDY